MTGPATESDPVVPEELVHYISKEGKLKLWPSGRNRRGAQKAAIAWLAGCFEYGRRYTEREVNLLLDGKTLFEDAALLRRELYEGGFLGREPNGSAYWRVSTKR